MAPTVQHNELMPSEIYCLYEKIQQFDNIKHKNQSKRTNESVSHTSSITQKQGQKTDAHFIALTVGEQRGCVRIVSLHYDLP